MRVCLIAPIPPFRGGIAKYCYSLAQELEKRHDLLLLSYRRQYPRLLYGRKSQLDTGIDRERVRGEFARLSFEIDSASPLSWIRTARSIARFSPDLVVLPWWVSYWAPMYLYLLRFLKKRGIGGVLLCINVFEHEHGPVKDFLTRLVLKRGEFLVVHSEQERRQLLELGGTREVKKRPLPLFEYREPAPRRRDGRFNLLFFGFVRPYKGLDTLLRALGTLKDRDLALKVAGEFWNDKGEYLKLIEELGIAGKVEVEEGYLPEQRMSRLFEEADLVVLPYKRSITSGVIATAYGFGKPVLATRVGGFHEVVLDGCTGKLVPPDDPPALAEGIVWFMERRETDFAGNIADFASREMSWSSLADTIESFR